MEHSDRGSQFRSRDAMESSFSLLQKNVLNRRRWALLGRLTPIEYETINTPQVALAA